MRLLATGTARLGRGPCERFGALQGLAPQHVIYTGSVSKALAPALRVGWLVAPERPTAAIVAARQADDLATPIVDQLALADFLERGDLDRHLRRTRRVYRPGTMRSWRLGYGLISEAAIDAGVRALAGALADAARRLAGDPVR